MLPGRLCAGPQSMALTRLLRQHRLRYSAQAHWDGGRGLGWSTKRKSQGTAGPQQAFLGRLSKLWEGTHGEELKAVATTKPS